MGVNPVQSVRSCLCKDKPVVVWKEGGTWLYFCTECANDILKSSLEEEEELDIRWVEPQYSSPDKLTPSSKDTDSQHFS